MWESSFSLQWVNEPNNRKNGGISKIVFFHSINIEKASSLIKKLEMSCDIKNYRHKFTDSKRCTVLQIKGTVYT